MKATYRRQDEQICSQRRPSTVPPRSSGIPPLERRRCQRVANDTTDIEDVRFPPSVTPPPRTRQVTGKKLRFESSAVADAQEGASDVATVLGGISPCTLESAALSASPSDMTSACTVRPAGSLLSSGSSCALRGIVRGARPIRLGGSHKLHLSPLTHPVGSAKKRHGFAAGTRISHARCMCFPSATHS